VHSRLLCLALSAMTVVLTSVQPARAKQPQPQTFPQPVTPATSQSAAPAKQPAAPAAPQSAPPAAPQSGQSAGGAAAQTGLPPPPVPPVLPPVPNVAPGYAAPANGLLPTGALVGVNAEPFVGIALDDAIGMALGRNTDLAVAQSNQRIANYQIVAAQGAYDIKFQLTPQYEHSSTATVSSFQAGPGGGPIVQDTAGATAGFSAELRNGQRLSVSADQSYVNSNSTINSFNPFYETALRFNFTQPLGRGTGTNANRRTFELALANAQINRAQALTTVSQTIANVSNTYWNLVAAWRNVGIQEEGLRQAQAQAQSNARLSARGAVAPVDIVESQTQVNVFQDNVFAALANVQRLQTQLKQLILANPGDPVWVANLVPTSPVINLPAEPDLNALIVSALKNRPEVAQLRAQRDTAATDLAYAKDQLRPQIDLNLGYASNGFAGFSTSPAANPIFALLGQETAAINELLALAGNPLPPLPVGFGTNPPFQVGGFGQSWKNTLDNRFPTYSVGITFTYPLGNRSAKADYQISREQAKQVGIAEIALLERIRAEAVNAIQQFRETQYRLVAASRARMASERVLLAEQRRFNVGSSTTFLVLQRQLDVANNRGRELQAQTDLNNAVVELNRVGGTVFAAYNIDASALGAQTLDATSPEKTLLPPAAPAPNAKK
jgi:outer membrane protein TolC